MDSGTKACSPEFDREKGLAPRSFIQLMTEDERESSQLLPIKLFVAGKEVGGVTGAETIRKFWRVAVTQKAEFNLRVVEGGKEIENVADLTDPVIDDVPSEGDVANGCAEEEEALVRGARNAPIQGIGEVDFRWQRVGVTAPNQRLLSVDVEANDRPPLQQSVEGLL